MTAFLTIVIVYLWLAGALSMWCACQFRRSFVTCLQWPVAAPVVVIAAVYDWARRD